jgi:hypothetical protein
MDLYYTWLIILLERTLINGNIGKLLNKACRLIIRYRKWRYKITCGRVYCDMSVVRGGVVSRRGIENARKSERWRCTAMKAGGGGGKQVTITGLVRRERAEGLHVPVREKLWLSDEPKRNVCNFVNDICDNLIRQSLDHFRDTCCGDRIAPVTSYIFDLPRNDTTRFVNTCCYLMTREWNFTNSVYVYQLLHLRGKRLIANAVRCSGCRQTSQLSDIKI